jgi:hypothetical protein
MPLNSVKNDISLKQEYKEKKTGFTTILIFKC